MRRFFRIPSCLFLFACLVLSCKNETPEPVENPVTNEVEATEFDSLKKEALKIHDEVMLQDGVLSEYRSRIKEQVKDSTTTSEFTVALEKLKEAQDGMMNWMHGYSEKFPYGEPAPTSEKELAEKTILMEKEVEKIKDLKIRTEKTIEFSRKLLVEVEKRKFQ
jgi:hypothetical protein